ncbi:MAG: TlpA disulfide reductase family protein [Bryobacteraceae bacterium]
MNIPRFLLVIAAGLALGSCAAAPEAKSEVKLKAEKDRNTAPAFALKDADGKTVNLSDYRGKVVLLNFWATWCGPCKIEIPWFIDFEQRYKDRGFAVLGVSMDEEGWELVKPYITQSKINYRILLGNETLGQLYGGVDSLPTTFLIDSSGKIVATHVGLVSKGTYEDEIRKLLDSKRTALDGGTGGAD